jgi:hypothetical protein
MKRRSFIQAAALSTVTALQSRGRSVSLPPVSKAPIEVDLANPDAARHIGNPGTDFFVLLEEMYPGDPGQLSGTSVRIMQSGKHTILNAEVTSAQRDGTLLSHCYGYLNGAELAHIAVAKTFQLRLRELYPEVRPGRYSGAILTLSAGSHPELQVCFGNHCLGVLRGRLLARFLDCVRQRTEDRASV